MVRYVDNGVVVGWFYVTSEGFMYGNGTRKEAERIKREREGC